MRTRIVLGGLLAIAIAAGVEPAGGNGRFPISVSITFRPGNTQDLYLGTTFGLLISHDSDRFSWVCEKNIGYEGTFDPKYRVGADGTIYATTFRGLRISRDGGCSFETATATLPSSDPGYINNVWVDAIDVGPNGDVWVATAESARPNDIFRSVDGGRHFTPTGNQSMQIWWKSLAVAHTDAMRVYATGYQVAESLSDGGMAGPNVHLRRTDDAGATWTELPITGIQLGSSPLIMVDAVSPTDPDIVFVRSVRSQPPSAGDNLYRSTDGGQSFALVLTTTDTVRNVVARTNGEVLVATIMGGVHRSDDAGATFTAVPDAPQAACMGDRGDALFSCGANWEPDLFSLGRSADGASWTKVFRFIEMVGPLQCPAGTVQHDQCEALEWPMIREMFGLPAGVDAGVDAPGKPPGDGGAGCCNTSDGAVPIGAVILAGVVLFFVRRRGKKKACCS